jgi:GT2 family glycosyltransferase
MRRAAQALWTRRHALATLVQRGGALLLRCYRALPFSPDARAVIRDAVFLSLELFILKTEPYQRWKRNRAVGGSRIHALLSPQEECSAPSLPAPQEPTEEEWARVLPRIPTISATVDVIIPVYDGRAETLRCIYSVLTAACATPHEVIVLGDASPDAQLAARLRELAARSLFTLIEQEKNRGFVATANHGMRLHEDRDAVLLNADTEVYGDWIDRLAAHARARPNAGSVTPFSNNATLCSYPFLARDNAWALETDAAGLDALAASANRGASCPLPTAVGFCMYIPRACLREVGYFDEEAFGRGYGEENDFCLRAAARGYAHLLAADVYVLHRGGVSFAAEKEARMRAAWNTVNRRHPRYRRQVAEFLAADPPFPLRRALDLARLEQRRGTRNVLMISHALGGGTEKHVRDVTALLKAEGTEAFLLSPVPEQPGRVRVTHPEVSPTPNALFWLDEEQEALLEFLRALALSELQVHHLIQFPHGMDAFIPLLAERLGVEYDVTIHDYYLFCPRINLFRDGRYCEEPEIAECERCVRHAPSQAGDTPVWLWRRRHAEFLRRARRVVVPDEEVALRIRRHFPERGVTLRPHPEPDAPAERLTRPWLPGEERVIAVLGAVPEIKGAKVLERLVRDADARALPLRYVLIGHSTHPPLNAGAPNFSMTGAYREEELEALLRRHRPHAILVPSVWPETYCYTLSHALHFGIWPVAFDLGAQAARIRRAGFGTVLPRALAEDAAATNDALLALP